MWHPFFFFFSPSFSPWTCIILPFFIRVPFFFYPYALLSSFVHLCPFFLFIFSLLVCCVPSFLAFDTSFFFLCLWCIYLGFGSSAFGFCIFGFLQFLPFLFLLHLLPCVCLLYYFVSEPLKNREEQQPSVSIEEIDIVWQKIVFFQLSPLSTVRVKHSVFWQLFSQKYVFFTISLVYLGSLELGF